jgi:hypothetical protein
MYAKVLVAALAMGAVQALPQTAAELKSGMTTSANHMMPSSTASGMPSGTSSADPQATNMLIADLITAPSAVGRFQAIIKFAGSELSKFITFDFNKGSTPKPEQLGGTAVAAVSMSQSHSETETDVYFRPAPTSLSLLVWVLLLRWASWDLVA